MAAERDRFPEDFPVVRRPTVPATRSAAVADPPTPWSSTPGQRLTNLAGSSRPGRGFEASRAAMLLGMQQTFGNRAVQRMVYRGTSDAAILLSQVEPVPSPGVSPVAIDSPAHVEPFAAGQRSKDPAAPSTPGTGAAQGPPTGAGGPAIAQELQATAGGGRAIDAPVRAQLEQSVGANLSSVRVHADGTADRLARALDATAFTSGQDVYFRSGAYQPASTDGMRLLAHEVTHTLQQAAGPVAGTPTPGGLTISDPSDSFERQADRVAQQASAGEQVDLSSPGSVAPTGAVAQAQRAGPPAWTVIQRCGATPCQIATGDDDLTILGTPARSASAQPVIQRDATDFQVRGKSDDAASEPNSIFFDFNESVIDGTERAKLVALVEPCVHPSGSAAPVCPDLTLKGLASEEGSDAVNRPLAEARIAAVEKELASLKYTGKRTPVVDIASSSGQIDYRSMRRVEIIPAGGTSAVPDCSAGADISCGPEPNPFSTAQARAVTLVNNAIGALGTPSAATTGLLDELFGGAPPATVAANLGLILTQLNNMMPVIPVGDATAPGHRCINQCEGNVFAYNFGEGPAARMTLGPIFLSSGDVDAQADTLVHEGSHGASGLLTRDRAYRWQRLIRFLDQTAALDNADSYALFIRLIDSPGSVDVGRATPDTHSSDMSDPEKTAADRSLAWLEQWLVQTRLQMRSLYTTIHESIAAGAWTTDSDFYQDMMTHVAGEFGLTAPPAVPTEADKAAVAAIYDRCAQMRYAVTGTTVDFVKDATGPIDWEPGPGHIVTLTPPFFALSPVAQVQALLEAVVHATPDVSTAMEPHYVAMIRSFSADYGSP